MSALSRRKFLGTAATVTGAAAMGAAMPGVAAASSEHGHEHSPHGHKHGDLRDIKHIVVIMQENRSFDHYFGALKGVRGFGDHATIQLPGGKSVWEQPKTLTEGSETQYPWRLSGAKSWNGATPPSPEMGAANYGGTSHGWTDQHGAWYGGLMNGWYYAKGGPTTLGYLDRKDLPFHYALADAYTVGDAYHCSVLSATGPNRTYLWSGTINAAKKHGTFTANDGGDELGKFLPWESYARRSSRRASAGGSTSAPTTTATTAWSTSTPSPSSIRARVVRPLRATSTTTTVSRTSPSRPPASRATPTTSTPQSARTW